MANKMVPLQMAAEAAVNLSLAGCWELAVAMAIAALAPTRAGVPVSGVVEVAIQMRDGRVQTRAASLAFLAGTGTTMTPSFCLRQMACRFLLGVTEVHQKTTAGGDVQVSWKKSFLLAKKEDLR